MSELPKVRSFSYRDALVASRAKAIRALYEMLSFETPLGDFLADIRLIQDPMDRVAARLKLQELLQRDARIRLNSIELMANVFLKHLPVESMEDQQAQANLPLTHEQKIAEIALLLKANPKAVREAIESATAERVKDDPSAA